MRFSRPHHPNTFLARILVAARLFVVLKESFAESANELLGKRVSIPVGLLLVSLLAGCGGGGGSFPGNGNETDDPSSTGGGSTPIGLEVRPVTDTCVAPSRPVENAEMTAERAFPNLNFAKAIALVQAGPPDDAYFVAQRTGEIYRFQNIELTNAKALALDVSSLIGDIAQINAGPGVESQQWGVTGIALHPDFPNTPSLFVALNLKSQLDGSIRSRLSRFESADGGKSFALDSETILLDFEQTAPYHHIGHIAFGPHDGYLYVASGDGSTGRAIDRPQDLSDMRGKILRIDVDAGSPYGIPVDNPFVGKGYRDEIYAYGLRNPWRFSFDRETGDLWVGDVGRGTFEEINKIESGGNYGWRIKEGPACTGDSEQSCEMPGLIDPIYALAHKDSWNAIIGGYVYRGTRMPDLKGRYLFADYASPSVWALLYDPEGKPFIKELGSPGTKPNSFAEDSSGELYAFNSHGSGGIWRLVPDDSSPIAGSDFPDKLSETGCFDKDDVQQPVDDLIPYHVAAALWSDGAEKRRWMAVPDGHYIDIEPDGDFAYPVGTVLVKEFSFDGKPFETRLLVRHSDGLWAGYSYEWTEEGDDARLLSGSKTKLLANGVLWRFPGREECLECHTEAAGFALGPEVGQLNHVMTYSSTGKAANQLQTLEHIGLFSSTLPDDPAKLPALASIQEENQSIHRRARSYLHANCAGCHRPEGPAQAAIDLRFQVSMDKTGLCDSLPTQGDLGIANARLLKPGDPASSVISARIHSTDLSRMPPLGTRIVDTQGAAVVDSWIASPDVCAPFSDTDLDQVADHADNCVTVSNPDQSDVDGDRIGNMCDPDFNG